LSLLFKVIEFRIDAFVEQPPLIEWLFLHTLENFVIDLLYVC
jgi:hypothetical protein